MAGRGVSKNEAGDAIRSKNIQGTRSRASEHRAGTRCFLDAIHSGFVL